MSKQVNTSERERFMSDFIEVAEGKAIDALDTAYPIGIRNYSEFAGAGRQAARATIESLRDGAVARLEAMGDGHNEPSWDCFTAEEVVTAILGLEPEIESDSPDESDIDALRYDEQRAAEKDES